jgi:hypothetical protein
MSNPDKPKAVRLTPPQVELLTDIATKPAMYITYGSRWDRTATALSKRDLAVKRFAGGPQYELRITAAGRAEAARRGIGEQGPEGIRGSASANIGGGKED